MGDLYYRPLPIGQMLRDNWDTLLTTYLVELISYFLFAGIAFWIVLRLHKRGVFRFRIRTQRAKSPQLRREIIDSSMTLVIFQFAQVIYRVAALSFGIAFDLEQPLPLWLQLLTFPLILVVHDAYF